MIKQAFRFCLVGLALAMASGLYAQGYIAGEEYIPPPGPAGDHNYAIIDSYTQSITMTVTAASAGEVLQATPNNDMYLRATIYYGGRDANHANGKMRAAVFSGSLPQWLTLNLESAACTTANSSGQLGNPVASPISLAAGVPDQDLITNIGTSYTGTGQLDGYQMTFNLLVTNISQLVAGTYNLTVRFSFHNR